MALERNVIGAIAADLGPRLSNLTVQSAKMVKELNRCKDQVSHVRHDVEQLHDEMRHQKAAIQNVRKDELDTLLPIKVRARNSPRLHPVTALSYHYFQSDADLETVFGNHELSTAVYAMCTAIRVDDYVVSSLCAVLFSEQYMVSHAYCNERGPSALPKIPKTIVGFVDRFALRHLKGKINLHSRYVL